MGFESDLLTGIAELLDEYGAGNWSPNAVPTAEPAIVLGRIPQSPERIISLAAYGVATDPKLTDSIVGVQVRVRGSTAPMAASDIADDVFDALHGQTDVELGAGTAHALWTVAIAWQSSADLGPDSNGRYERSDNYYVTVNRPSLRLE